QDRRVLQQHAGNGDALALAAGELDAALADLGVVAAAALGVDQFHDEVVRIGLARGLDHLFLGRVGPAVHDVLAYRAVQQRGVLGDHADGRAERILGDRGDVGAVDPDRAAFAVVEAQQQVDQGRLAGAGAADQADLFARAHVQVQALDHAALLAVVEGHVVEVDVAAHRADGLRAGPVVHGSRQGDGVDAVLHRADVL